MAPDEFAGRCRLADSEEENEVESGLLRAG